jgi:hypothetical protein
MFLHPNLRILVIAVYGLITWKFLSLGVAVVGAGLVGTLEARLDTLALFPLGVFFIYVGMRAFDRLRHALNPSGPGF